MINSACSGGIGSILAFGDWFGFLHVDALPPVAFSVKANGAGSVKKPRGA